jgi:hypothetical protein
MNARTREIARAVDSIKPYLRGRSPVVQGAVIADLLAIWLAGHQVEGSTEATRKLRADMLAAHVAMVEELVAINAKILGMTA